MSRLIVCLVLTIGFVSLPGCGKKSESTSAPLQKESEAAMDKAKDLVSDVTSKVQGSCPMTAESIDKSVYADVDGNRIYMCCKMCKGKFMENAQANLKKITDQGITLEKTPGS